MSVLETLNSINLGKIGNDPPDLILQKLKSLTKEFELIQQTNISEHVAFLESIAIDIPNGVTFTEGDLI